MSTVDMRDFIGPPYWPCPKCGKDTFGVMIISRDSYMRRCRECWHKHDYPLPRLKKKIIYLDQFVISELMKLNNPSTKGHSAVSAEPFWQELSDLLKQLRKLQLLCCPSSGEHVNESLLSPFYKALKSTYDHLSGGVSFNSCSSIKSQQIAALARAWARGEDPVFDFEAEGVISGDPHAWLERFYITTNEFMEQHIDVVREVRKKLHEGMSRVFNNSYKVNRFSFVDWFELERNSHQKYMLRAVKARHEKKMELLARPWEMSLDDILNSEPENTTQMILDIMARESQSTVRGMELAQSFFVAQKIGEAPFNRIGGAMHASIALKAAAGQKKPPNQGMVTDIELIETLLPYCDAMFMDNGCRAVLMDVPKPYLPAGADRVYSLNRKAEFLSYLRLIRDSASPEHLRLIREVYGDR